MMRTSSTQNLNKEIDINNSMLKGTSAMRHLRNACFVLLLGAMGTAQAQHIKSTNPADWWFGNPESTVQPDYMIYVAPDVASIPNDATGNMIRYGKQILEETYKMLGPESGLPTSYVGNRLSCSNCHLETGRAAYGQPWAVVWYKYSAKYNSPTSVTDPEEPGSWSARTNSYLTMKNRIHDCTMRSMNGFKLPDDSYELNSMVEYMKWLSTGIKVSTVPTDPAAHTTTTGQNIWEKLARHGAANVIDTGNIANFEMSRAADPKVRGKAVYEDQCAACHGFTGEGVWDANAKKFIYPAVWGQYSFNNGAGMYRLRTAVGFVKGNMPYGWANPTDSTHMLATEDAWDAMAYVIDNYRPQFSGSLQDWLYYRRVDCAPNWVTKITQLDAGYESYYPRIKPDGTLTGDLSFPPKYSADQHKYGPWKTATYDMTAEMRSIQTAYLAKTPRPVFPACVPFEYKP